MSEKNKINLALFYCQNVPESGVEVRKDLEQKFGERIRLFPFPCSGRMESVHLLRALEEFADAAYLITCPDGACRYFEGNRRAKKRVERTREMIQQIGLEGKRIGALSLEKNSQKALTDLAQEIYKSVLPLGPSPVFKGEQNGK